MLQRLQDRKKEDGFTLVELLIVVVILGALASTVVVASTGFRTKGVQQSCQGARRTYEVGFEAFRADNADGNYPSLNNQLTAGGTYIKAAGGSTVTLTRAGAVGVTEVAVIRGKGWQFTITYGVMVAAPGVGSATAPVFSAFNPAACVN